MKFYETPAREILKQVAEEFDISVQDLLSKNRERRYSWPRGLAYLRIYCETSMSYPQIGRLMNRDHTTIIYGVKATRQRIKEGKI